jgi:regulator of sirC expression with transglutaminase-like and TPR domain
MEPLEKTPRLSWRLIVMTGIATLAFSGCARSGDDHSFQSIKKDRGDITRITSADTLWELIHRGSAMAGAGANGPSGRFRSSMLQANGKKPFDTSIIPGLLKTVYDDWGISFNPRDSSTASFIPRRVFEKKQGTCLGIALLLLFIAEKNGYPLYGVVLPGHFFLRFDDGSVQRNIEPNASGIERTDNYYRQRYGITPDSWYYPLRNLSKKEVAAIFFYMVGNVSREKGELSKAQRCYDIALRLFPDYPDALGNMAIVLAGQGKVAPAITLLDRAALLNPADPIIGINKDKLLRLNGSMDIR